MYLCWSSHKRISWRRRGKGTCNSCLIALPGPPLHGDIRRWPDSRHILWGKLGTPRLYLYHIPVRYNRWRMDAVEACARPTVAPCTRFVACCMSCVDCAVHHELYSTYLYGRSIQYRMAPTMAGAARECNTAHTQKHNEQQKSAQRRPKPPPAQSRRSSFLIKLPYGAAVESVSRGGS